MTKPHHVRRALLIALTVVAILPTLLGSLEYKSRGLRP